MNCRHCGEEIRLTSFKLSNEPSVYLHVETNIRTCYDIKKNTYHTAQPR